MTDDDDQDALAAEYVLGTLDPDERGQAQALMAVDAVFAASVRAWERRLGELYAMVDPVEPPAQLWDAIDARRTGIAPSAAIRLPELPQPKSEPREPTPEHRAAVIYLTGRIDRWRNLAAGAGALAAALLVFVAVRELVPGASPPSVVVQAPPMPPVAVTPPPPPPQAAPARHVAVLQRDAGAPAFLLTVDIESRTLTVRRVAAERDPKRDYELWLVHAQFAGPRSLGLIGADEFTIRPALESYDPQVINSATYAVSLEPEGGSPTGTPTGPVLFTGRLIEAAPPAR